MKRIENKGLKMSAVYANNKYSRIYLAWHENKKVWIAESENNIEYFDKLSEIRNEIIIDFAMFDKPQVYKKVKDEHEKYFAKMDAIRNFYR